MNVMNGVARLRNCLLGAGAVLATAAIGCGGSLVKPDGGAGTISGSGGDGPGGAGGAAEGYNWAGAIVSVAPTSAAPSNMTMVVEDQASPPALSTTLPFSPTTRWDPTDGAGIAAQYTCSSPGLYAITFVTCANQNHIDRGPAAPGCLLAIFTAGGTTGSFIHPSGAYCDITSAKATIQLPPPNWAPPSDGGPPPDAAVGTFEFNCENTDGTHLFLGGQFILPVSSWTLLC